MLDRRLAVLAALGAFSACAGGSESDTAKTVPIPIPTPPPAVATTTTPAAPAAPPTPAPGAATGTPAPEAEATAQATPAANPSAIPASAYLSAEGTGPKSAGGVVFRPGSCLRYFVADRAATFRIAGMSAALAAEVPGASGAQVELYASGEGSFGKAHRAVWLREPLASDAWDVTLGATKDREPVRWTFSLTESSRRDCRV